MKKSFPLSTEFIYQVFALIVIVIVVHAVYVAIIRPHADAALTNPEGQPVATRMVVVVTGAAGNVAVAG